MANKAVFLDRDGTISEDVNYCSCVEDFHMLPTVPAAIRLLNISGYKVVVVTNQSGIARGYFTEETVNLIHEKMCGELAQNNATVDAIYFCPHHPDDDCDCRKPKTGLFKEAAKELQIDLASSYMIGDMQSDIDVGKAAGCGTILVTTGPHKRPENAVPPDYTASSLLSAVEWLLNDI